nr:hypothetical protein [Angustibacter aerolatus]
MSTVLWTERELLEPAAVRSRRRLVLASARTRWLAHATREVEMVIEQIRGAEPVARRRGRRPGLEPGPAARSEPERAGGRRAGALGRAAARAPRGVPDAHRRDRGDVALEPRACSVPRSAPAARPCWVWRPRPARRTAPPACRPARPPPGSSTRRSDLRTTDRPPIGRPAAPAQHRRLEGEAR